VQLATSTSYYITNSAGAKHARAVAFSDGSGQVIGRDRTALGSKKLRPQGPRTRLQNVSHTRREDGRQQSPSAPLFPKLGQGTAARQQHQGPGSQEHGPDRSSSPKGGTGRQARDEITRKAEPCLLVGKETDSSRQAGLEIRELSEEHPRKTEEGRGRWGREPGRGARNQLGRSGAWRPVWRAGPEGEPHASQHPPLRARLAAEPCRDASLIHWWLR